jgi:hypothetical protein
MEESAQPQVDQNRKGGKTMADNRRPNWFLGGSGPTWLAASSLLLVLLAAGSRARGQAQGPFAGLAQYVPTSANAIVLLNVDTLLQSPLGLREGWKENLAKAHDAGLTAIPPKASRFIMAAQLDFGAMAPAWEMAVAELNQDASMEAIARSQGGRGDTVDNLPAAVLPSDAYVVQFGPRTVGGMSPANRQNVARWIREAQSRSRASLSPYLAKALGYADDVETPIIIAVDLAHVFPVEFVEERIRASQLYAKRTDIDVKQLAQVLSTIEGMTLGIVVDQRTFGQLKVEFGVDPSIMKGYARVLLLEALRNNGLMIDDFENWKVDVAAEGNQISIKGYLTKSGLQHVLSLVEPPTVSAPREKQPATATSDATDKEAYASQQYFRSINQVLENLRNKKNVKTIAQYGTWFENYARRIDRLPMLNVDSDLLNYGGFVSERLRDASMAIKGIGMNQRAREVNRGPSYATGSFRGVGGMFSTWVPPRYESQRERSRIRTEEKVAGAESAINIMQDIENASVTIRRSMVEKYQVEF